MTTADGGEPPAVTFTLNWLATPGTQLLLSGLLTMLVLRIRPRVALRAYKETLVRLRPAIVTVTNRGETANALALGLILLILAFSITLILTFLQQKQER